MQNARMRNILAIDPGKSGGIAACIDGAWGFHKMPGTIQDVRIILQSTAMSRSDVVAYIEELPKFVRAIPSSAVFVMARNYGQMEGILAMCNIPVVHVRPQVWQKAVGAGDSKGMTRTAWKNKLKGKAQDYFPDAGLTLDTCDAALIAYAAVNRLI